MKSSLFIVLFCSSLSYGQQHPEPPPKKHRLQFSILSGYQQENFRWSIAGNTAGSNPNIYSELSWKNLTGPVAGIEAEWNFWKGFSLRSACSRLFLVSGKVTDRDYQGDDRTNPTYFGAFDSDKGYSNSWRTLLEYRLKFSPVCSLTPGIGYAYQDQSLFLLSEETGPGASKLRSTYATAYKGLTLGLRAIFTLTAHLTVEPSLLYDQISYRGRADWNLIPTFRHPLSFEDLADGYDIEGLLKVRYACNDRFSLFLSGNYFYGNTGKGTDRLYLTNGQEPLTRFNGALRHAGGERIGLSVSL